MPYQYENNRASDCDALMQSLSGADTFNPIIQVVRTDSDANWGLDAKVGNALEGFNQYRGKIFNSSNSSATVNLQGGGSQTFASKTTNDAEPDLKTFLIRIHLTEPIDASDNEA